MEAWTRAGTPLFPLLTTWKEVRDQLLPRIRRAGPVAAASHERYTPWSPHDKVPPVYENLRVNPDAGLNTIRYMFYHTRCGVWVSIRKNRVAIFTPFANASYTNTFGTRIRLTAADLTVEQYSRLKAEVTRRRPERLLGDKGSWWLNGGIMCNVMPDNVWGPEYLASIKDMLDETCARHSVPDCDFVVNKRDFPQMRREVGREPYARFVHTDVLPREVYSAYVPVFSFYTGTAMADLPMPTADDWTLAIGKWLPGVSAGPSAAPTPWRATPPATLAVFRGTGTGTGITEATNARLRLVQFSKARPDLVDAKLVGFNLRDRVVGEDDASGRPGPIPGPITVDFLKDFDKFGPTVPFMPLVDQAAMFAYVVYVDGHCAASRFGTLLASPMVVLRVCSEHADTCGHLWLFDYTKGARVTDAEAPVLDDADHLLIDPDLGNMEATVHLLRARPDLAAAIVGRANARAPSVSSITAHWRDLLLCVHHLEATCPVAAPPLVPDIEWFSPCDPAYAAIQISFNRPSASSKLVADE